MGLCTVGDYHVLLLLTQLGHDEARADHPQRTVSGGCWPIQKGRPFVRRQLLLPRLIQLALRKFMQILSDLKVHYKMPLFGMV